MKVYIIIIYSISLKIFNFCFIHLKCLWYYWENGDCWEKYIQKSENLSLYTAPRSDAGYIAIIKEYNKQ